MKPPGHRSTEPGTAATLRQPAAVFFVLYAASTQLAAWTASLAGQLSSPAIAWGLGAVYFAILFALAGPRADELRGRWRPRMRRFRRLLPAAFGLTALMVILAALLHPNPADYDHLTYRFPRVLHWWAEGRWFRIPHADGRLNYSGMGFEWMWYPIFLVLRSDFGAIFLNVWGFLLLPGLVFRGFTGFGVGRRIAAAWMWVLPAAHALVFQASGAGNDLPGTVLALAAFAFLFDAVRTRSVRALGVGLLAAALCSGIKLSNAPLLLPLGILALACVGFARAHVLRLAPVVLACMVISFLPMAVLNRIQTGSLTGDPENRGRMQLANPAAGLIGNGLQTVFAAVVPPVNPAARWWNDRYPAFFPGNTHDWLRERYPRFTLRTREIAGGEEGTIGLGLTAFLLFSWASVRRRRRPRQAASTGLRAWVRVSTWASFLLLTLQLGSEAFARVAIPYIPVLLATLPVLRRGERFRCRQTASLVGAACLAITWPALVLTPARPLWPWREVLQRAPKESTAGQLRDVYEMYAQRPDAFAPLKAAVPDWDRVETIGVLGFIDDPETSLWRPFDGRRVFHISPKRLEQEWVEYDVLIGRSTELDASLRETESWRGRRRDHVRVELILKAQAGPEEWTAAWRPAGDAERKVNGDR